MIVDKIENIVTYDGLSKGIVKALELLRDGNLAQKADGRYEVEGKELFYLVSNYVSKPIEECKFETHEKYVDVQALLAGQESMGYAPVADLTLQMPYDSSKDIAFYRIPGDYTKIALAAGMFCVFYPNDGHMPGGRLDGPSDVHKVIIKVRIA
jgi:YhcH/YjgK/YiaL family protein